MKVQNPIIGRARGKAGGMVFTTWKGRNVAKAAPDQVANPNTEAQQFQRQKMTEIAKLYNALAIIVTVGFSSVRALFTEYNIFTKDNIKTIFTNTVGTPPVIDASKIKISKGSVGSTPVTVSLASGVGTLEFNDEANELAKQTSSDVLYVAAFYNDGTLINFLSDGSVTRADGGATIALTGVTSLTGIKVLTFFASPDFKNASNTVVATAA